MKRIVIVEREAFLARMLSIELTRAGYETQSFGSVDTAWDVISANTPDAVVMSEASDGEGIALCQRLRSQLPQRDIPAVVVSGCTDGTVRRAAHALVRVEVLEKPVSVRNLLGCLEAFFDDDSLVDTLIGERSATV